MRDLIKGLMALAIVVSIVGIVHTETAQSVPAIGIAVVVWKIVDCFDGK